MIYHSLYSGGQIGWKAHSKVRLSGDVITYSGTFKDYRTGGKQKTYPFLLYT